jgi:hypothetical protein
VSSWEWQAEAWARWARTPGHDLGRHRFEDTFERDGLQVTLAGWRYSLEEYARALEDAGLLIERLREPPAPAAALAAAPGSSAGNASPTSSTFAPSSRCAADRGAYPGRRHRRPSEGMA